MTVDDEIVTFRLGPRDRAAIQRLIDGGEFRNRSDFLRFAVKSALDDHDARQGERKARAEMEMEGIELPPGVNAQRSARPRPAARKGVGL